MAIEREQLQHMLDQEEGAEHVIREAVYCGRCGYQLRMLPYSGRCPECGNWYNARGHKLEGILTPQAAPFPASDLVAGLLSALILVWLVGGLTRRLDLFGLLFAGLFGYMAVIFLRQSWRGLREFIRAQRLADRAFEQDDDDD